MDKEKQILVQFRADGDLRNKTFGTYNSVGIDLTTILRTLLWREIKWIEEYHKLSFKEDIMKIYLETSTIIKNLNYLNKFQNKDVFTSSLVVFELISGIKKRNFYIRQNIIKKLFNSSIYIDWETYKQKYYNSFQQSFDDIEGYIIKTMAKRILECKTFDEYKEIKIFVDVDTYYTHESFEEFDNDISCIGKFYSRIAKEAIESGEENKGALLNMFKGNLFQSYVHTLKNFSLIYLAEDISGYKRPSNEFFNMINKYNSNLDVHLNYIILLFLLKEIDGSECGKNDTMDMLHLAYVINDDIVVSEDKIFKKLNNYMQLIKIYNSNEFECI